MSIAQEMARTIASRLKRHTVDSCSRWAELYRKMGTPFPGPWTFDYHPWLIEMLDCDAQLIIGQKAAQLGYTEAAMNIAFYSMDILQKDVLYVLPTRDDASQFSSGRFDPAVEKSPHLQAFFTQVDNVKMKRGLGAILYIRGSKSRSQLKSIPTPIIIFDEVDEMPEENVRLAEERQSGQIADSTIQFKLSTPTIPGFGINADFEDSTQSYYNFKCPSCSRLTELKYPESIVITADEINDPRIFDSHYICYMCKATLPHEAKPDFLRHKKKGGTGRFIETKQSSIAGFHVNQMYSSGKAGVPGHFATSALKAELDETDATEFHNSNLGKTYVPAGSKVNDEHLAECTKGFHTGTRDETKFKTMGIDVGSVLHIVIKEWTIFDRVNPALIINDHSRPRTIWYGKSKSKRDDFEYALKLIEEWGVGFTVVDAEPESRAAYRFACEKWGQILLCDYNHSQRGRSIMMGPDEEARCTVNRTSWLDITLGRYKNGTIELPQNLDMEFKNHVKEPVRVTKEDKNGNPYATYLNAKADHYAHADNYAEIALPLGFALHHNMDLEQVL